MGSRYLTDLADVLRRSGYPVIEVDGWQDRARGSGGYNDGKPDHVCCHHTASGASMDGWGDVEYMTFNHGDAPLCNLYLDRSGTWYVCAGGGTNTNGSGDCPHLSPDTMNSSAIGIEAGNNGVGEEWPHAQQDSYVAGVAVLLDGYGIPLDHVHGHAEWAPSRKIDMAGNSRYASGGNTWNFDQFRGDIREFTGGPTPPHPEPEPPLPDISEDDVKYIECTDGTNRAPMLIGPGWRHWARSEEEALVMRNTYGNPTMLDPRNYDVISAMASMPSDGF